MRSPVAMALILILSAPFAHAAGDMKIYLGGGLGIGQMGVSQGSADAKFRDFSYSAIGGVILPFGDSFGFTAGAAYGENRALGNIENEDYLENANNRRMQVRGGFNYYNLTLGGGVQENDLLVKSVSTGAGAIESKYSGQTSFYFVSYGLVSKDKSSSSDFMTTIEISQSSGKLEAVEYQETTISLNLVLLFGLR